MGINEALIIERGLVAIANALLRLGTIIKEKDQVKVNKG